MVFPSWMKFHLGRLIITPAVLMGVPVDEICYAIDRHVCGLWGDVCDVTRVANEAALLSGGRLLSVYHASDGTDLRVLTTGDRLITIAYLPSEPVSDTKMDTNRVKSNYKEL